MTWLRLTDDFADDAARAHLTDREFRVHVEALLWIMRREAGPELDTISIKRSIEVADPSPEIARLCELGWWEATPEGWRVVAHMIHQPEPEVIAKRKAATAERVRRHRLKAKPGAGGNASGNTVTECVAGVGSGRDGTGTTAPTKNVTTGACAWCEEPLDGCDDEMHPRCLAEYREGVES